MQKVSVLSTPVRSASPVVNAGCVARCAVYEQFVHEPVDSTMEPAAPRPAPVNVTPTVGFGGVMFPGAEPLQLGIASDQLSCSISWSVTNSTVSVVSIGWQHPAPVVNSWNQRWLTSVQLF